MDREEKWNGRNEQRREKNTERNRLREKILINQMQKEIKEGGNLERNIREKERNGSKKMFMKEGRKLREEFSEIKYL